MERELQMVLNFHSLVLSWEPNSGFLKKQYVLLSTEKSLQPRSPYFFFLRLSFSLNLEFNSADLSGQLDPPEVPLSLPL